MVGRLRRWLAPPQLRSDGLRPEHGVALPFGDSLLLVWPQITGLIAPVILLFALTYVIFPFVAPAIGFARGVGPLVGLLIGSVAIVAAACWLVLRVRHGTATPPSV